MALQDAVGYHYNVAIIIRGLLPHIFTLTAVCSIWPAVFCCQNTALAIRIVPAWSSRSGSCGGSFLLPLHKLFAYLCFPQCTALSCPDFPPNFLSDRTARRGTKVKKTQLSHNIVTSFGEIPFSRTECWWNAPLEGIWKKSFVFWKMLLPLHLCKAVMQCAKKHNKQNFNILLGGAIRLRLYPLNLMRLVPP